MMNAPDYSGIPAWPDGRSAAEYERDYRRFIGEVQEGAPPSPEELASAPFIRDWEIRAFKDPETERLLGYPPMKIWGYFEGHPFIEPNELAFTSPVLQVDPDFRWARCASRVYRLQTPNEH